MAILDADKEGFLRTETSLIQTIGRAARNVDGKVVMYGDRISKAMQASIDETRRRRNIQQKYNEKHGITPKTIEKSVRAVIEATKLAKGEDRFKGKKPEELTRNELKKFIESMEKEMRQAADSLQFERAAELRDRIFEYKTKRM